MADLVEQSPEERTAYHRKMHDLTVRKTIPIPFKPTRCKFSSWTTTQLKKEAGRRKLDSTGAKPDLVKRLRESDQRPGIYRQWSLKQLKRALRARNVEATGAIVSSEVCIGLLDALDRNDPFPRFFELPRKIRDSIYELVCAPAPNTPRQRPSQPAICRVSQRLRKESLPVFLASTTFMLTIYGPRMGDPLDPLEVGARKKSAPHTIDIKWLQENKRNIHFMRKLVFNLAKQCGHIGAHYYLTQVSFSPLMDGFGIMAEEIFEPALNGMRRSKAETHKVPKGLKRAVKRIAQSREELTYDDLYRLVRIYMEAY